MRVCDKSEANSNTEIVGDRLDHATKFSFIGHSRSSCKYEISTVAIESCSFRRAPQRRVASPRGEARVAGRGPAPATAPVVAVEPTSRATRSNLGSSIETHVENVGLVMLVVNGITIKPPP